MKQSLEVFVKQHIDLLSCSSLASGASSVTFAPLKEKLKTEVINHVVALPGLSAAAATATIQLINGSMWDTTQRAAIVEAINEKLCQTAQDDGTAKMKVQENLCIHKYLTSSDWQNIFDKTASFSNKLKTLAIRCRKLQLKHGREGTLVQCLAIAIIGHRQAIKPEGMDITPHDALAMLRDFKVLLKIEWKSCSTSNFLPSIDFYPHSVKEFEKLFPEHYKFAYPDEQPRDCPLDATWWFIYSAIGQ